MKRIFDVLFSILGVLLSGPGLLLIAFLIKREDGRPIFYRGPRVGWHNVPFRIYKFRTMVMNAEKIGGHRRQMMTRGLRKLESF